MTETTNISWLTILKDAPSGAALSVLLYLKLTVLHQFEESQIKLAKILGLSKDHLSRTLGGLNKRGYISIEDTEGIHKRISLNPVLVKSWSRYFLACKGCLRVDSPHKSRGYCRRCDWKLFEKEKARKFKERVTPENKVIKKERIYCLNGKWSRDHDSCVECGKTDHKNKGYGWCSKCYDRHFRRTYRKEGKDSWWEKTKEKK